MMKKLIRIGGLFCLALLLMTSFTLSTGHSLDADTSSQAGVSWTIHSESDNHTATTSKGTTQDYSEKTEQNSSDQQGCTYNRTFHVNEDGSSHENEELICSANNCFNKELIRDTYTDVKGTRKVHSEETTQKDKICYKYVADYAIDRNNKEIYHNEKDSVMSCSCGNPQQQDTPTPEKTVTPPPQYTLEVHWEGSMSGGSVTIEWGPETDDIPLTLKENSNNVYEGSYQGEWHAQMSGECIGTGAFTVSIEVSATENGDTMDFTVKDDGGAYAFDTCKGKSGSYTSPATSNIYNFTLPIKDGASKSYTPQNGKVTETFTLKVGK